MSWPSVELSLLLRHAAENYSFSRLLYVPALQHHYHQQAAVSAMTFCRLFVGSQPLAAATSFQDRVPAVHRCKSAGCTSREQRVMAALVQSWCRACAAGKQSAPGRAGTCNRPSGSSVKLVCMGTGTLGCAPCSCAECGTYADPCAEVDAPGAALLQPAPPVAPVAPVAGCDFAAALGLSPAVMARLRMMFSRLPRWYSATLASVADRSTFCARLKTAAEQRCVS